MDITEMTLCNFSQDGERSTEYYYHDNFVINAGTTNQICILALANHSIKVQTRNCAVYESLSSKEAVQKDTAIWEQLSDNTEETFVLQKGVSYLKAVNTSETEPAKFNITCL